MSNLLGNIDSAAPQVEEKDVIFTGGQPDSGLYPGTITLAYLSESQKGAVALNLHFTSDGGRKIKNTIYFTSGKEKGKKTYYENKNGDRENLPGFSTAQALSLMTTGEEFLVAANDTETKTVKLYDFDAKAEVPKQVEAIPAMMGERVVLGIVKTLENKRKLNEKSGKFEPVAETREVIEIDKVFQDETLLTVIEVTKEVEEAKFVHDWETRFAGKTIDKTDKNLTQASGGGSGGSADAGGDRPKRKLFGNKA